MYKIILLGFISNLVFWQIFNKLMGVMSQISNLLTKTIFGSLEILRKQPSSTSVLLLDAKNPWACHSKGLTFVF